MLTSVRAQRGATWLHGVVLVVILLALGMLVRWFLRSDEQRISERVDLARDALVERDQAGFLDAFTDDVVYRGSGDRTALAADLRRWCEMGLTEVHILQREIEVDAEAGTAEVWLQVLVGHQLVRMGNVEVDLVAVRDEGRTWRVRAFSWKRP